MIETVKTKEDLQKDLNELLDIFVNIENTYNVPTGLSAVIAAYLSKHKRIGDIVGPEYKSRRSDSITKRGNDMSEADKDKIEELKILLEKMRALVLKACSKVPAYNKEWMDKLCEVLGYSDMSIPAAKTEAYHNYYLKVRKSIFDGADVELPSRKDFDAGWDACEGKE